MLGWEAEHRDAALTATERGAGLTCICVSRAETADLVLDLSDLETAAVPLWPQFNAG